MHEMLPMLQRLVGDHIQICAAIADGVPAVRVDRNQFGQVIVNLVTNARDAMTSGGTLSLRRAASISTRSTPRTMSAWCPGRGRHARGQRYRHRHRCLDTEAHLRAVLHDQGDGVRRRARSFDRRTASSSRAAATSGSTASRTAGRPSRCTVPGSGSSAVGVASGAPPGTRSRRGTVAARRGRAGRAGDRPSDPETVRLPCHAWRATVPTRSCSANATRVQFDLVITDVVMPGMSGSELVSRSRARRPGCVCCTRRAIRKTP